MWSVIIGMMCTIRVQYAAIVYPLNDLPLAKMLKLPITIILLSIRVSMIMMYDVVNINNTLIINYLRKIDIFFAHAT